MSRGNLLRTLPPHRRETSSALLILIEQSLSRRRGLSSFLSEICTPTAQFRSLASERASALTPPFPPSRAPAAAAAAGSFSAAARKTVIDSGRPTTTPPTTNTGKTTHVSWMKMREGEREGGSLGHEMDRLPGGRMDTRPWGGGKWWGAGSMGIGRGHEGVRKKGGEVPGRPGRNRSICTRSATGELFSPSLWILF